LIVFIYKLDIILIIIILRKYFRVWCDLFVLYLRK